MKVIDNFKSEEYKFLANFYGSFVTLDGEYYPTVEHAFQAAKTPSSTSRAKIRAAKTASEAKRIGRSAPLRPDWNQVRESVMRDLVEQKFSASYLRDKLLATENATLVSGGDQFWGCINGVGQNRLGKILMDIRNSLFQEALENYEAFCRDFLIDCGWEREASGDVVMGECWVPPGNPRSQYSLSDAVQYQVSLIKEISKKSQDDNFSQVNSTGQPSGQVVDVSGTSRPNLPTWEIKVSKLRLDDDDFEVCGQNLARQVLHALDQGKQVVVTADAASFDMLIAPFYIGYFQYAQDHDRLEEVKNIKWSFDFNYQRTTFQFILDNLDRYLK